MNNRKWILHAAMQARAIPLGRAARGMVILALAFSSLGAGAAARGYGSADHARAHQSAASIQVGVNSRLTGSGDISYRPWMY